ncbi:hypothetical protein F4818DRAFT_328947 [Hypoxylon cercidicola]|nr:hypothetical protein F4818DRAFT_328947 [Hypoxylon cercidicola]
MLVSEEATENAMQALRTTMGKKGQPLRYLRPLTIPHWPVGAENPRGRLGLYFALVLCYIILPRYRAEFPKVLSPAAFRNSQAILTAAGMVRASRRSGTQGEGREQGRTNPMRSLAFPLGNPSSLRCQTVSTVAAESAGDGPVSKQIDVIPGFRETCDGIENIQDISSLANLPVDVCSGDEEPGCLSTDRYSLTAGSQIKQLIPGGDVRRKTRDLWARHV